MLACKKCNVSLLGHHETCPLCGGEPWGEASPVQRVFPAIPMEQAHHSLQRRVTASVVILCLALFCLYAMFPETGIGPFVAIGVLFSLWISFYFVMRNKRRICKNIFFQVVIIALLTDSWDSFTGYHRWSITYVVPLLITLGILLILVLSVARKMRVGDYALYLLLLSVLGVIGYRYLSSSAITMRLPMFVCFCVSVGAVLLLLLFKYGELWLEIRRRLHL